MTNTWSGTPDENGHPSKLWLRDMWTFVCSEITDDNLQSCLEPIRDWPLFPQTSGKLVPPSLSKTIVLFHTFCDTPSRLKQVNVLRKLRLPEVKLTAMCHKGLKPPSSLIKLMETYSALPTNQESIANVVKFMLDNNYEIGKPSEEIEALLQYFQEGCETMSDDSLQTIKMLQIFELPGNKTTDLQNFAHYHIAESYKMEMAESEIWMKHMDCMFLEPRSLLTKIYEKLGITIITDVGIYLSYILPSFHLLSQEAQLKHLKNITQNVLGHASEVEKESIIQQLSSIPFIIDGENFLRTVDYFFDPAHQVFKKIVPPNKLLPKPMEGLRDFLKKIGLQTEVTQDLFVEFAKEVETRARQITNKRELEDLTAISKLLINVLDGSYMIQCSEITVDSSFLLKIANIKFIPSLQIDARYVDICPTFAGPGVQNDINVPFISYSGSVSFHHWKNVWSVAMLLPQSAIPNDRKMCKCKKCECKRSHDYLGIQKDVLDKVLSHADNVCRNMGNKNAADKLSKDAQQKGKSLQDVMKSILKFLNKENLEKHGDKIKSSLQSTSICVVDNGPVVVRADQLVFDMTKLHEQKLRPYLYKTPRELLEFENVLKLLGAQDTCSFDQLAGVLSAIKTGCGENRLEPNERGTALTAVRDIFSLLHNGSKCEFTVSKLYLPSTAFFLKNASHLYYAHPNIRDQLLDQFTDKEFIIPLKQCGLGEVDEMRLIELLPEPFRPKNLGNEMQEKPCDFNEDCPAGPHCSYLEHIKRMMNSEEMTRVFAATYTTPNGRQTTTRRCHKQNTNIAEFQQPSL